MPGISVSLQSAFITYLFAGSVVQLICEAYRLDPGNIRKMPIKAIIVRWIFWPIFYPFECDDKINTKRQLIDHSLPIQLTIANH